ncbi:MAG TPA: YbaN family protein [Albidovulum sp.]|uniref:YbaN family protein n=1 Tax=Albidovulum sp. TaxID=1872424 RepID=UPI002BAA0685|nr:YbaN family protein [Albidovulum sp.]
MRAILVIIGLLSLALGVIGIFLPIMPTVPFLLLAAVCFANASERLHSWLLSHPLFGPPIQDWNERGAIGRNAKWLATASFAGSIGIAVLLGFGPVVLGVQAFGLIGVAIFIWSRPDA